MTNKTYVTQSIQHLESASGAPIHLQSPRGFTPKKSRSLAVGYHFSTRAVAGARHGHRRIPAPLPEQLQAFDRPRPARQIPR